MPHPDQERFQVIKIAAPGLAVIGLTFEGRVHSPGGKFIVSRRRVPASASVRNDSSVAGRNLARRNGQRVHRAAIEEEGRGILGRYGPADAETGGHRRNHPHTANTRLQVAGLQRCRRGQVVGGVQARAHGQRETAVGGPKDLPARGEGRLAPARPSNRTRRPNPRLDNLQVRSVRPLFVDDGQAGHQAAAPSCVTKSGAVGRCMDAGHLAPSGQFSDSQRIDFSKRRTWMSPPSMIAPSFLLSPNSLQLTVVVSAPVARPYSAASSRS